VDAGGVDRDVDRVAGSPVVGGVDLDRQVGAAVRAGLGGLELGGLRPSQQ